MILLSTQNSHTALSYKFLADVIYEVQGEPEGGPKTRLAQVASALDKLEGEFKNRTKTHFPYKEGKSKELTSDEQAKASKYPYQSLLVSIPKSVLEDYKKELGTSQSQVLSEYQAIEDPEL